jgi:hypothetical protein
MSEKPRVSKDIHVDQGGQSVTIWVIRWQDKEIVGHHSYLAAPYAHHLAHRSPGFIARRIRRCIRLMSASLKREWGQA